MIGLCCDKTYRITTNHNDGDGDGDNDGNEDKNDSNNAASGSGSNGLIFDLIATPRSCLGLVDEDWTTTTMALRPR